jgi:hypothetical protein
MKTLLVGHDRRDYAVGLASWAGTGNDDRAVGGVEHVAR